METNTLKIVIANQKGGTGKSTVAVNLAVAIQSIYDGKLAVVDTDTQSQTTTKFRALRDSAYINIYTKPHVEMLNTIIEAHDYVIVDTGGFNTTETKAFIATADIVLMPLNLSGVEMDTFTDFALTIQEILHTTGTAPKLVIVPTRIHHLTRIEALEEYYRPLTELGYYIAPALRQRKVYQDAHALGKGVIELDDANARTEIHRLATFVMEMPTYIIGVDYASGSDETGYIDIGVNDEK